MSIMIELLESITEEGGSFTIEWNPQRGEYKTVAQYIEDDVDDFLCFESDAEQARAIKQDTIVTLQWYPSTPLGFYVYAAPDNASLEQWFSKDYPQRLSKRNERVMKKWGLGLKGKANED